LTALEYVFLAIFNTFSLLGLPLGIGEYYGIPVC